MTLLEKITRILQTRKGSRPGNYNYGSRIYLLRDKRADPTTVLLFAKYAKEDIERSDPTIVVRKAKLIGATGDKFRAMIEVDNASLEVTA